MKKNTIYLLLIFVVFLILSSYVSYDYSVYKCSSRINSSKTQGFENENQPDSKKILNVLNKEYALKIGATKPDIEIPIKVDGCSNLEISIVKNINVGLARFIPLYKVVKFDAEFDTNWSGNVLLRNRDIPLSKRNSFAINGDYKIVGICSASKTRQIIHDRIMKEAQKIIKENIRSEIETTKEN